MVRAHDRRVAGVVAVLARRREDNYAAPAGVAGVDVAARVERNAEREPARAPELDRLARRRIDAVNLPGLAPGVDDPVGPDGDSLGVVEPVGEDRDLLDGDERL